MGTGSQIIWSMIFGSVGLGYFIYGKKQKAIVPLVTGIALFLFPYFISNIYILITTGVAISAVPYFVKI